MKACKVATTSGLTLVSLQRSSIQATKMGTRVDSAKLDCKTHSIKISTALPLSSGRMLQASFKQRSRSGEQ